jgi:KTSC domain
MRVFGFAVLTIAFLANSSTSFAETIQTKYCGSFDTAPFDCEDITRSSFIKRVCFDAKRSMILLNLRGVYYCKCGLDEVRVTVFKKAPSMGRYFNEELKGRFHCQGIDKRFP